MTRERISLISDDDKKMQQLEDRILSGEINKNNYEQLNLTQQNEVNRILFEIAEEKINLSKGVSAVEFVLFAFIRLISKQVNGVAMTAEDKKIEAGLQKVLDLHEIYNENISMEKWLFNYMEYAETAAIKILGNREDHIQRKKGVTGHA
ncbi:hypothetical protein [Virgibacillus salexigens]|uniref:Uncharacterized protein n=1 Tax=Virgibacillus massiliensis TaxID=1462526 RepID=A0A024QHR3_9BACI|nr:hypothetical protein [Virgibacillus massiliensis]CDQ41797.1 hypothetical protein BN990_04174 [Virgibacillus massiliensis]